MLTESIAREAPAPPPISMSADPSRPQVPNEPQLEIQEIQGNIVPGFNKDFQTLLFLKITDVSRCRVWLKSLIPFIATTEQVLAFNRLFKSLRSSQGSTGALQATWVNVAFTFAALKQLTSDADQFVDGPFKAGLAAQASGLGDPVDDPTAEGNPLNWLIGNEQRPADLVVVIAGDTQAGMLDMVSKIQGSLFGATGGVDAGLQIVFQQQGAVLPGPMTGHEHFGFLDGVSQPGVRGRVSADPADVLTPRQNPADPDQGKPGQDLLWPGEFVFGYPGQDASQPVADPGPVVTGGPVWSRNGSLLVFRRLRQDVGEFHRFLNQMAAQLNVTPAQCGATLVGRWTSGAPILRAPLADNPALGNNDCANNNFEFFDATPQPTDNNSGSVCAAPNAFPPSPGDQPGQILPLCGHIRKAYPRDDITPAGTGATDDDKSKTSEQNTQTHRMLRRGIPFGKVSNSTPDAPLSDDENRGLLFLSYQTSIAEQFEFVTQKWINNPNFRDGGAGFDLVIGQNSTQGENRVRTAQVRGTTISSDGFREWVVPTGGGYFFAPSISAIKQFAGDVPQVL